MKLSIAPRPGTALGHPLALNNRGGGECPQCHRPFNWLDISRLKGRCSNSECGCQLWVQAVAVIGEATAYEAAAALAEGRFLVLDSVL